MVVPPKMTELVSKYVRLKEVYGKLQNQNQAIYYVEKEHNQLVEELKELKGMFKGQPRKLLQENIDTKNHQLQSMKGYLIQIVKPYH